MSVHTERAKLLREESSIYIFFEGSFALPQQSREKDSTKTSASTLGLINSIE